MACCVVGWGSRVMRVYLAVYYFGTSTVHLVVVRYLVIVYLVKNRIYATVGYLSSNVSLLD